MHSIKIKFILAISLLVILISGSSAFLLIKEKENELTTDIYQNSRLFADLSSDSESTSVWRMHGRNLNHNRWDEINFSTVVGLNNRTFTTSGLMDSPPAVVNGYVYISTCCY